MLLSPVRTGSGLRPQILGGEYPVSNVEPTDLSVHYSFLADIYRQTKDLPEGTRISGVTLE